MIPDGGVSEVLLYANPYARLYTMAQTVRIDPTTHVLLSRLAEQDGVTLQEELARAVRARERARFFREFEEGLLCRTDREREEDAEEQALWDRTSADGLEDE